MNDYKEMREGKILLNRFPYNECNGCLCIQHVSNSGVMEELRLNCYSEKVTNYLLKEAKLLRSSLDQEINNIPER